jgi:hypothetical protein
LHAETVEKSPKLNRARRRRLNSHSASLNACTSTGDELQARQAQPVRLAPSSASWQDERTNGGPKIPGRWIRRQVLPLSPD